MLQACHLCGIGFDLQFVQRNPFPLCPNPACHAPLDADAVAHKFVEAGNPSDPRDTQRIANRAQHSADVALHEAATVAAETRTGAPGDKPGVTREELDAAVAGVVKSLPGMVDAAVAAKATTTTPA